MASTSNEPHLKNNNIDVISSDEDDENNQLLPHSKLIDYLCALPLHKRNRIIKDLNRDQIDAITSVILNYLEGNLPLTIKDHKKESKLAKLKKLMKAVCRKTGVSLTKRKAVFTSQKGGFILGLLLPAAASVLGNLIGWAVTGGT